MFELFPVGLWKILIFSVSVLFIAFAVNAISFYNQGTTFWRPYFWRLRWILLDAWLNVLYLVIFIGILILWRPTENNQRYGLVELAQDDYDEYDAELNEVNHHHYDGREEEDESPKTMVNNINNNNVQVDGGEGGGKRPQQHHQDEEFGEDELFEWAERLPDDH